jgi:hypothetical protein
MDSGLQVTAIGNWSGLLKSNFWTDLNFRHNFGSWQNFAMTSPETLYIKNAVTHMAYFDTRFG